MPELAEVEYYRKQWDVGLDQPIIRVSTHPKARIYRDSSASQIASALSERTLLSSETHGKQMLFQFSDGAWLGLHLGMTGKLFSAPATYQAEKHDHLVLHQAKQTLVFSDSRMFGKVTLDMVDDDLPPVWWRELPPRPLDPAFTKGYHAAFVKRFPKTPVKTLLLDQRGYPGIGNWMADEICWRLPIAPDTQISQLSPPEIATLWKTVRQVSREALRVIADDWGTPPDSWLMNHRWKDGGHCPRPDCGTPLRRDNLRGRKTCWCPKCQPA